MKRFAAAFLAFVLMLSLVPFGAIGTMASAMASEQERAEVLGEKTEVRKSGKWLYSIMKYDIASIEGYEGDAASLRIPTELDGFAVGAIADNAFASQTKLASVTIPTQVFSIGENAFANPASMTVTGYDGSAGLAWAKANGANVKSLTDMYLNEGIVDLSGVGSAAKKGENNTLLVNNALSFVLEEGTMFFFTATDKYGMNYWGGLVTGVSRDAGGAVVSYQTVSQKMLIDKIYASSDMEEIKYEFTPAPDLVDYEGGEVDSAFDLEIGLVGDIYAKASENKTFSLIPSKAIPNKTLNIFGIPVTVTSTLVLDFNILYDPEVFGTDRLTADIFAQLTTTLKAEEKVSWKKTKRLGEVTIYGVKGFRLYVPIDLVLSADGSVVIDIKDVVTFDWTYDSNKNKSVPKPVLSHETPKRDIIFTGNASAGLKIGLAVEACGEDLVYVGMEGGVKIHAKLTLPRSCLDLDVYLYKQAHLEIIFLKPKTFKFDDVYLFDKHYELVSLSPLKANDVKKCTREDKTVKFELNGGEEMRAFNERTVAWNSSFLISEPTRKGYNFMGWYTNEGLTNPWVPGDRITENTTLYASWEKKYVPVTSVSLNQTALTVYTSGNGHTKKLTASVKPGDATNAGVKWTSSNRGIASVDANGNVTGIAPGKATITATSSDNRKIVATCTVTVKQYVNNIKTTIKDASVIKGNTTTVSASVLPANATSKAYTWSSSNTKVATVNSSGVVTAVSPGTANIIATASDGSGVKGSVKITVLPIPVASITLNRNTGVVYTTGDEQTLQLSATVLPANAGDRTLKWTSSDNSIAVVDANGKVTGKSAGTCVITATSVLTPTVSASFECVVKQYVSRVSITQDTATLNTGSTLQLFTRIEPQDATNKQVKWISNRPAVATVTDQGVVKAIAGGTAVISAVAQDGSKIVGQCVVKVNGTAAPNVQPDASVSVTGISLDFDTIKVFTSGVTNKLQLTAAIEPANAGNPAVVWTSSNTTVATVDSTGLVTGVKGGTAVITARSAANNALYAQCTVTVEQLIDSITLSQEKASIYKGEQLALTAAILPASQASKTVRWSSSDPAVAKVDHQGLVKAVGVGNATITASAQDGSTAQDTFAITVMPVPVSSVTLNKASEVLYTAGKQNTVDLVAVVGPEMAEDKSLTWSSSNTSVATVDQNGKVTGVGVGTAVITVKSNSNSDKSAKCTVVVKKWVTGIALSAERTVMIPEETLQIQCAVTPSDATNTKVNWTSDNENIAKVSSTGLVDGCAPGTVIIRAEAADGSGVIGQIEITVTEDPVYAIELSDEKIEIYTSGDQSAYQLSCELLPARATYRSVTWYSSNNDVAYVDGAGRVVGVTAGTAVIGVQADSNPEIFAECQVTVKQRVESVHLLADKTNLLEGETLTLQAEVAPADATVNTVTWSTSNKQVATVSAQGVVTAVAPGKAVIRVTANDGSGMYSEVEIQVEKWLSISGDITGDAFYYGGNTQAVLGEVMLSTETARRLKEAGLKPEWTLSGGQYTKVALTTKPVMYWLDGQQAEYTSASLQLTKLLAAGTDTYTLTCKAGSYTASMTFKVVCIDDALPEKVSVGFSDVTVDLNEKVVIPAVPTAVGTGTLPMGMVLSLNGEDMEDASVVEQADGFAVSFAESSIYTVTATYKVNNVQYDVDITIRVRGTDGIIRLPVREVVMSAGTAVLTPGEKMTLAAAGLYGSETVDCKFTWTSSNENVVKVDANGNITAVGVGVAVIEAIPDSGRVSGSCSVTVENVLDFVSDEVAETVYWGGEDNLEIANVVITEASARRLVKNELLPEWKIEKVSGNSVELAVQELDFSPDSLAVPVVGSLITLVRIYGVGDTEYRLTCVAGDHEASIPVIVRVANPEKPLPDAVALVKTEYEAVVGEVLTIQPEWTLTPAASALPEDTFAQVMLSGALGKAVSELRYTDDGMELEFNKSGVFKGTMLVSGTNYSYEVPFTVTVADENGQIAKRVEEVILSPEEHFLMVGESVSLTAVVMPEEATDKTIIWTSYDPSVASVSDSGKVTAIGPGRTIIHAVSADTDVFGECVVYVENGLTMERSGVEMDVYLDGLTRTDLDTFFLSYASSLRMQGKVPTWTLKRVKGSCLTLEAVPVEESVADGTVRFGAAVNLHSVTRTGTAVYDLTCAFGDESATLRITVNAVERAGILPDHVMLDEMDYYAGENELIVMEPQLSSVPASVPVPAELRLNIELDDNGAAVVNANDYFVSRTRSTISFSRAGTYYATFVYSCGNVNYENPVVFHIADENGDVPIFVNKLVCEPKELFLEKGDTAKLKAVFYPQNATEQGIVYASSNTKVATVSADGTVTAVANGYAQITLTPVDEHVAAAVCNVTVEEGFNIIGATNARELYLQGTQRQNLTSYMLTEGTLRRLAADGLTPQWKVTRKSGAAATHGVLISDDQRQLTLISESLKKGGTDIYTITCTAGPNTWSQDFTLNVIDLGADAPKSVSAKTERVAMTVGQTKSIVIEPVCAPAGTALPDELTGTSLYTGVGNFYDALDLDVYDEDENQITVAFTKPGTYILLRTWSHLNLQYSAMCLIDVAGDTAETESPLLQVSGTECTVYAGGKSDVAVTAAITDSYAYEAMEGQISWKLSRISGSSVTASLVNDGMETGLFVANVKQEGTDVWRLTCTIGCYSESVDITVHAVVPRAAVPDSIELVTDTFQNVAGEWIFVPFAVSAKPAGSKLPDTGKDFWTLDMQDTEGKERVETSLTDTGMMVRFSEIGSYTGKMVYESGNVRYSVPVYFYITDDEGQVPDAQLNLVGKLLTENVWLDGKTNVNVMNLKLVDSTDNHSTGAAAALVKSQGANWQLKILSGASYGQLSIEETVPGQACIVLDSLNSVGKIEFEASCTVKGNTYKYTDALMVVDQTTPKPVLNMGRNLYTLEVGETVVIDRRIFNADTGIQLASASDADWKNGMAIEAMGFGFETAENTWMATFYENGEFRTVVEITVGNLVYSLPLNFTVLKQNETEKKYTLSVPTGLVVIEEEAMMGIKANILDLRGSNVEKIGSKAFGGNADLELAYLPASIQEMENDAFEGSDYVIIVCPKGSYVERWATANGYAVQYEE